MRNLKRTLSLVLAMALVVGMMMVGASAASSDFTDSSEITYTEAVDVMNALGVIEGTDTGAFNPSGTLTREQAAAIICRMLLGDSAEDLNTNSTVFTDVAADRWSAGYIGYCAQQGILAGTGNGTFNPEGELTGLAFAKMLLVALGYDATIEQYVGSDWAINVAADAIEAGVSIKGQVMANSVSREQAAQMAFNTLEADLVRYSNRGTTVIGSDGMQVIVGASAPERIGIGTRDEYVNNGNEDDNDGYTQFCERYFSDLKKTTGGSDDYGAPADVWKYNDFTGKYAEEASLSYTDEIKVSDLKDDLDEAGYDLPDKIDVYSNGNSNDDKQEITVADVEDSDKFGGKGVKVDIYTDDNSEVSRIVMTYTYVGQVVDVTEDDEDTSKDERELEIDVYMANGDTATITVNPDTAGFASVYGQVEEDDYVLVTPKGDSTDATEALDIALPKTVTGTVTGYTKGEEVTMDGTDYEYNAYCYIEDDTVANFQPVINEEATFVLDAYGNVIAVDAAATASNDYVYLADFDTEGASFADPDYIADAYFTDGTRATIVLDRYEGEKLSNENKPDLDETNKDAGWYTYTETRNGEYRVNKAENPATDGTAFTSNSKPITENGKATIAYGESQTLTGTNSTVFVVKDGSDVTVYTGIRNVPDITTVAKPEEGTADPTTTVSAVKSSATSSYATYVFINLGNGHVKGATSSASDLIYILSETYKTSVDSSENTYYTFDAIVNGEKTTVSTTDSGVFTGTGKGVGLYNEVAYDEDDYVDSASKVTDGGDYVVDTSISNQTVTYSNGVLVIDGHDLILADEYAIRTVDGTTVRTVTPSRLANQFDGKEGSDTISAFYAVLDNDGFVTSLYVAIAE